jgi:dTDP-4-amino-4,6-dideoxygalactose transaminase
MIMEERKIIFSPPDITEEEIAAVGDALRSGWITTGPRTKELEKQFAEYVGVSKCVCLNSATAAEELNFRIAGIGEGDEVIVPAYTYTASASAALHAGATIRFVDSQPDSPELDYDALESMINEKTKAIVPVDLGGIPCDYDRIMDIVERKKALFKPAGNTDLGRRIQEAIGRVLVIEDGAHAVGSVYKGRKIGSIADFTSFSFHAVKNLTTAEGGAASWRNIPGIDNEEIYHQYQLYSLHGQSKDALAKTKVGAWEYDIEGAWYKCNMTDVCAAIGLVQLKRYPGMLARRKEIIQIYGAACDSMDMTQR